MPSAIASRHFPSLSILQFSMLRNSVRFLQMFFLIFFPNELTTQFTFDRVWHTTTRTFKVTSLRDIKRRENPKARVNHERLAVKSFPQTSHQPPSTFART